MTTLYLCILINESRKRGALYTTIIFLYFNKADKMCNIYFSDFIIPISF